MVVDLAQDDARQGFIAKRPHANPDFGRVVRDILQFDRDAGIAGVAGIQVALQGVLGLAGHRELQVFHRRHAASQVWLIEADSVVLISPSTQA